MNDRCLLRVLLIGVGILLAPGGRAETGTRQTLSELDAVQAAVEHNPNLHVALLRETQARAAVSAEEGLYAPVFSASAGVTHARQPSMARGGDVSVSTSDTMDLGAGITQAFPLGTVLSATLQGQRSLRRSPITAASTSELTLGPGYSLTGQISAVQPLLRGAGTEVGRASLRAARQSRTIATLSAQQTASELMRDVLLAYWELWYADAVIRIDEASRDLAVEQERQASEQAASGAIARGDALPYRTQRAQLEEAVVTARADRLAKALTLAGLLGDPDRAQRDLRAGAARPGDVEEGPTATQATSEAVEASYQLRQLEAQIDLARDQARTAGDSLRPRLDLEAYAQAQGLGYRAVPPAFEQFGRMQAVSVHAGVTFEMPLTDQRREAQIEEARLAIHIAEKQLEAARQQLRSQVLSAIADKESARTRLAVSEETEKIAREQAEAERTRFQAGASVALQVQVAEDSWRQAQLRVLRARVDVTLADIELAHLRGRLLERYAGVIQRLRPSGTAIRIGDGWGPM
jgi:outer membrane protein